MEKQHHFCDNVEDQPLQHGGKKRQVKHAHSGVPPSQSHSSESDSNAPHTSSHVSLHLFGINWQSVLPHRQVSSNAQIPLQTHGVLLKSIEQLDKCSKCWEDVKKQGFVLFRARFQSPRVTSPNNHCLMSNRLFPDTQNCFSNNNIEFKIFVILPYVVYLTLISFTEKHCFYPGTSNLQKSE